MPATGLVAAIAPASAAVVACGIAIDAAAAVVDIISVVRGVAGCVCP